MRDLKVTQMNMQQNLIREPEFYNFELGDNTTETTQTIFCAKGEDAVNHSRVTRWLEKLRSGCKNFDHHTRSGRLKSVDSEAML